MFLFAACKIRWLGLRPKDLHLIPQHLLQPLTPRDITLAKNLLKASTVQVTDDR